jgi:hypothetical protein
MSNRSVECTISKHNDYLDVEFEFVLRIYLEDASFDTPFGKEERVGVESFEIIEVRDFQTGIDLNLTEDNIRFLHEWLDEDIYKIAERYI